MDDNNTINLEIIKLSSDGRGVSKTSNGLVVFTDKTLPGDKVNIKIKKRYPNYAVGEAVEITEHSRNKIKPRCKHFGVCGGCKIQNLVYEQQLIYKKETVRDKFEKIGGFGDVDILPVIGSEETFFYRNKMEFSFSEDKWYDKIENNSDRKNFSLGLHIPGFHTKIIDIEECFLQSEITSKLLDFTREFFKERMLSIYSTKTHSGYLRFLIIRIGKRTGDIMLNLITYDFQKELAFEYEKQIKDKFPELTTIINSTSVNKAQIAVSEKSYNLYGEGFIYEKLFFNNREYVFKISPNSFFQTNTLQAEKMFEIISDSGKFSENDIVLDLYCGTGAISILISQLVQKVIGVEIVEDAIFDGTQNLYTNEINNVEFVISDIKQFMSKFISSENRDNINKIIIDPPRAGLHPEICRVLSRTEYDRIVYVSCNPATQARDLKMICSDGKYVIDRVQPIDMFPHTLHIENIVSLKHI